MTDSNIVTRMIPYTWSHSDIRPGHELPMLEWCRWNADGSYYVDWERARLIAITPPDPSHDLMQINQMMMAGLLHSARGKFTEVSLAEADRIAADFAERYRGTLHWDVGVDIKTALGGV